MNIEELLFKSSRMVKDKCSSCLRKTDFTLFAASKGIAKRNRWEFLTSNPKDKGKLICDKCLYTLYQDKRK
jgi:hypothetical protein